MEIQRLCLETKGALKKQNAQFGSACAQKWEAVCVDLPNTLRLSTNFLAVPVSGNEILILGNKRSYTFDIRAVRFTSENETNYNAEHGGMAVFYAPGRARACIFSDYGDPGVVEYGT